MTKAVLVKGHIVGPRQVELDAPVPAGSSEVEVLVRTVRPASVEDSWPEYFRRLPPGRRTQANIDAQLKTERDSWGEA
jgi:hypothetical protein